MPMTLPVMLTWLRIALIPILVICYYLPFAWTNVLVVVVFVFAALSDVLDGWLARRLGLETRFGAFLDPVADKLMVATALLLVVGAHPYAHMVLPAIVIIGREIAVSALREWMAEVGQRKRVKVSLLGKLKTIAQFMAVVLLLYGEPIMGVDVFFIGVILLYLATALTLWSMALYLRAAWQTLSEDG